jgi:lipid-A-disaccharide synthase-like uncharacterized protein
VAFWYFSLAGGSGLLLYAIHRGDPVFVVGQAFGLLVYGRNLHLIRARASAGRGKAREDRLAAPE